uniref:Histone-lysine N-methyltransferase SETMAR n=1 Tax=Parastrongyloides trichosuri TaxID=131310 RepID=A0A0N4ZTJ9_PARTI
MFYKGISLPMVTIPNHYVETSDDSTNEHDNEEYSPHVFEFAKQTAVKRKIIKELEDWLVSHDFMMNCYEKDHEGWHRFPLRRRSIPEDMEYMDQITNCSFLDGVFQNNKDYFFVDDWRDLIAVKTAYFPRTGRRGYAESFGKSAERLNDIDPQQFYVKALENISSTKCQNMFYNRKTHLLPFI